MVAISIVIPVYNVEKYLKECLDSILNQTFKDFEVICVNDGSTDNSLEILNEYAKKDVRFKIIDQENQGAGAARNKGLEFAQGEYVQFLDGDDFFEPTMLEDLYNKALEHDTEITICSAVKVDEENKVIEKGNPKWPFDRAKISYNRVFNWKDYPEDIFDIFNVIPWNKLYKKSFIVQNNIEYQNLSSCNDITFSHIARVLADRIVIFNKELINYKQMRSGSISSSRGDSVINILHSAVKIKSFLEENGLYRELEKAYTKGFINHIRTGISYCNDEQYNLFVQNLKKFLPKVWEMYKPAQKKDYITIDFLSNFIGNNKVYLWGASLFLKKLLEKEEKPNPNILGVIDKNEASWGKDFGNYKIYSPEILKKHPAKILLTVYNDNEDVYDFLKKELKTLYPESELLDNIFTL